MGCIPRLENHYPLPWMGAIRTLAVYIAMTFLRRVVMLSRSRKFGRYPEARWANCALGTIQASIALLVLWSLVHPSLSFAANPELETVLTGSRQRIEKLDYRMGPTSGVYHSCPANLVISCVSIRLENAFELSQEPLRSIASTA